MKDEKTPVVVAIATCIQVALLALFYADFFFDWGLPGTTLIAGAFLVWGFSVGWMLNSKKGGDCIGD